MNFKENFSKKINIILAETGLHLIFSSAVAFTFSPSEKKILVWFGSKQVLENYQWLFEGLEIEFIVARNPNDSSFFSLKKNLEEIKSKTAHIKNQQCHIVTYYDTAYGFEILRHLLKAEWKDISILDDGQVNYMDNIQMPAQSRRVIKNFINIVLGRFPINTSKYNLGGNIQIKKFYTLSPENLFLNDPKNSEVISIIEGVKTSLDKAPFNIDLKKKFAGAQSIINLPPIYCYKRKSKDELILYLEKIIYKYEIKKCLIKYHPRDHIYSIDKDIRSHFNNKIILLPNIPTEFLFRYIPELNWFGAPSSSILNRHFLYPDYKEKFLISDFGTSKQFSSKQLFYFKRILTTKFELLNL